MWEIKYHAGKGYQDFKNISKEEFLQVKLTLEFIRYYRQFEELFELVRFNISELWTYLVTISEYHRLNVIIEYDDFADPIMISNQRLANILTSFRTYLDHIGHQLSQRYGDNSEELNTFNTTTNELFDKYFSYRFFSKLRNYLQHFGIPITKIMYNKKYDQISKRYIYHSVSIFITKEELLKYKDWGNIVKNDLINIKDEINVKDLLNEFLYSVIILYKKTKSMLASEYDKSRNYIMSIYDECLIHSKEPINKYDTFPLIIIVSSRESLELSEDIRLPIDMIKRVDRLIHKHLLNEENILFSFTNMVH